MTDVVPSLMRLAPRGAIAKALSPCAAGGSTYVSLKIEDFDNILRHFLGFIPFDEAGYLRLSPELKEVIGPGRPYLTAKEHFIKHGYFEGRRPFAEFLPEHYSLNSALRERPPGYFEALYGAAVAADSFDFRLAEKELRVALSLFPESYQANRLLGLVLHRGGRPLWALPLLSDATRICDEEPQIRVRLGAICQTLYLPDERVVHLKRAFELTRGQDNGLTTSLADALIDLGHCKDANRIFSTVPREALGGHGVAARDAAKRAYDSARSSFRNLASRSRQGPLSLEGQVELADRLARLGFRQMAGRRLNTVMACFRASAVEMGGDAIVRLAEATRISRGLGAAVRVLALPHKSDNQADRYKADLLYRAGQFQDVLRLASATQIDKESGPELRNIGLSFLRLGDADQALGICRAWMALDPASSQWATLALMALLDRGDLRFTSIPTSPCEVTQNTIASASIPRRIVHFWNDDSPPDDVRGAMASWSANNPSFEYQRYNDATARQFVEQHLSASALDAFDACQHPAMRGDYFRLAFLASTGGIFVDADERNVLPLAVALAGCGGSSLIVTCSHRMVLLASPLAAAPQNSIILSAFESATAALLAAKKGGRRIGSWEATGPGVITRAVVGRLLGDPIGGRDAAADIAILSETDGARVAREETFAYKQDAARNWRLHAS